MKTFCPGDVIFKTEDERYALVHLTWNKTTELDPYWPYTQLFPEGATLMDVRMESEHATGSIKGSVNVPLYMLRLKAENLDRKGTYICYCETGRRSQAAAYLLSEAGFQSYTLKGGLQAMSEARNR